MKRSICGIDFGTSNSAIAALKADRLSLISLEGEENTIPSAIFFNLEEDTTSYGRQAINEYLEGYSGRLLRSLKSVLGSSLINERTQFGGERLSFIDIIGKFVGHIKETAEQKIQNDLDSVVMGRPVYFVDNNPAADQKAENELRDILKGQGFKHVSFEYEPIAAAKDYEATLEKEELVLVFDIGGGTSDFTLMRLSPSRKGKEDRSGDILASAGIHIGGTDFDRQFNLKNIMPEMGLGGEQIGGLPIPSYHFHLLATWHLINTLYTRKNMSSVRELCSRSADKSLTNRFLTVVTDQRGHELLDVVEKAKIALSTQTSTTVDLSFIERGWNIPLLSSQLETAIRQSVDKITEKAVEAVTNLAEIEKDQVDTIFLTGGSTGLPRFERRIAQAFPKAKIARGDRFSSVVTGLGLTAIERYGQDNIASLQVQ